MARKPNISEQDELGRRLADKIGAMVGGLIAANFAQIQEIWDGAEDRKLSLSAKIALEGSARQAVVGVKLGWSQKFEAQMEGVLDDPDQGQLPIGEDAD